MVHYQLAYPAVPSLLVSRPLFGSQFWQGPTSGRDTTNVVMCLVLYSLLFARPGSNIASGGEGRFSATARFSALAGTGGVVEIQKNVIY